MDTLTSFRAAFVAPDPPAHEYTKTNDPGERLICVPNMEQLFQLAKELKVSFSPRTTSNIDLTPLQRSVESKGLMLFAGSLISLALLSKYYFLP